MDRPLSLIDVEETAGIICIHFRRRRVDESELSELMDEMLQLADARPGSKFIVSLGPEEPIFLYSVFLAKLVRLQRRIRDSGGSLKLADLGPNVREIFQVCHLDHLFEIYPDRQSAIDACTQQS